MTKAIVTTKGQVTIPKEIRDYLNLDTGSKVDFIVDENGTVKLISLNVPIHKLSGILHKKEMIPATLSQMEEAIIRGACDWT